VVTGGQYDVDVTLEGPTQEIVYSQIKTQFDSHQFTALVRTFLIVFVGIPDKLGGVGGLLVCLSFECIFFYVPPHT
jgi:hypothetical protein